VGALFARDGDEAIRIIGRFGPPMLLIVDLSLSRRDGFAVIESLRSDKRARSEIIAWSAFRELREFAAHRLAGMNVRILRSGVASPVLRGAIEHALSRRSAVPSPDAAEPTAEQIQKTITDLASRTRLLCGTPGVAVYLRAPGASQFRASITWSSDGLLPHSPFHIPRVFDWIQQTGEAVVMPDLTTQPISDLPTATLQDVVQGLVAVPIFSAADEIIGAICVFDVKPLALNDSTIGALRALGHAPLSRPSTAAPDPSEELAVEEITESESTPPAPPPPSVSAPPVAEAPVIDWPTQLLTRTNGEFAAARELARTRREQRQLSVVLFDISDRSAETPGWGAADLDAFGDALLKTIRLSDLPIRWSEHELLVVLPGLTASEARGVAERVRAALHASGNHRLAVSAGVAELQDQETFGGVVARARDRVRLALERGHNRVA
jgi:diguanylate cyclase (GGDEF)-like protein